MRILTHEPVFVALDEKNVYLAETEQSDWLCVHHSQLAGLVELLQQVQPHFKETPQ